MTQNVKIIADLKEHEQSRIALLEDGKLAEIFIEYNSGETDNTLPTRKTPSGLIHTGDIFKARIETLVPAISAAFLKISPKSNAFMYVNESASPESIKPGHAITVQVSRTATGNKSPRVTPQISLPGRWLVLVPGGNDTRISRRIADNDERKRLKDIADEIRREFPGFGLVVRTAAEGASPESLRYDMNTLLALWNDIEAKAESSKAPCVLYSDIGALGRVLRDEVPGKVDEIIIDDRQQFERAEIFIERFYPDRPAVTLYDGITPIFEYFGIEDEIRKALDRKIWLKSGAYLVIDQTEALTVIDVNTGKFTSAHDMRQTVLATNIEAAGEIARQLRLRSIGGIVIVDFVDMEHTEDRHELLKRFEEFLSHDRLKPKIFSLTKLGLVELTRKRERPDLKSILTRICPHCNGAGVIEREESIALTVKRFIRKITASNGAEAFVIQADIHSAGYMSQFLGVWEEEFCRKIYLAGISDFARGKYRLEYQGSIQGAEEICGELRRNNKGKAIIHMA